MRFFYVFNEGDELEPMGSPKSPRANWSKFLNQTVVVDTDSSYLYLGKLVEVTREFLSLEDVDVHDTRDAQSTKEQYAIRAKQHGVFSNRKAVSIKTDKVISLTLLSDIKEY